MIDEEINVLFIGILIIWLRTLEVLIFDAVKASILRQVIGQFFAYNAVVYNCKDSQGEIRLYFGIYSSVIVKCGIFNRNYVLYFLRLLLERSVQYAFDRVLMVKWRFYKFKIVLIFSSHLFVNYPFMQAISNSLVTL